MNYRAIVLAAFLVITVPLTLFEAVVVPPFVSADEPAHWMRTIQVARGVFVGSLRENGDSGGDIPIAAITLSDSFSYLFPDKVQVRPHKLVEAWRLRWNWNKVRFVRFGNTAWYSPLLYLPEALGIQIARLYSDRVLGAFYLARLFNAAFCLLVGFAALAICRRGQFLMLAVLCLPSTVEVFGAIDTDGLTIAFSLLGLALLSANLDKEEFSSDGRASVSLALGLAAGAKISLTPMLLLPLLLRPKRTSQWLASLVGALPVALGAWMAARIPNDLRAHDGITIDSSAQWHQLLADPLQVFPVALRTLVENWHYYWWSTIGPENWVKLLFSPEVYWLYTVAIALGLALEWCNGRTFSVPGQIGAATAVALSAGATFLALYLIWSAVGGPVVLGVQGRYLIPFITPLSFLLPGPTRHSGGRERLRHIGLVILVALLATGLWTYPRLFLQRW